MIIGSSPFLSRELFPFFTDNAQQYGDMYRMSNLKEFKMKILPCPGKIIDKEGKVDLYIIGDSFLERISSEKYVNVDAYNFIHYKHQLQTKLDTSKRNILVIESVERNVKIRLEEYSDSSNIVFHSEDVRKIKEFYRAKRENRLVFNAEKNFEKLLFNDPFSLVFKEIKASLNYHIFDRVDKNVILSGNKQTLFYYEEIDSTDANELHNSSFNKVSDGEIDTMIRNINRISAYYKKAGFDEIYFTIPPNKVSIEEPQLGNYNHIIERIRDNKNLKVNFIDIYSTLKNSSLKTYPPNDTHWNCEGQQLWIDHFNKYVLDK
jgi:hypothetical protein